MQTRTAWQLRGRAHTYLIVRRRDLWCGEVSADPHWTTRPFDLSFLDPGGRAVLEDLYRAVCSDSGQAVRARGLPGGDEARRGTLLQAVRRGQIAVLHGPALAYGMAYGGALAGTTEGQEAELAPASPTAAEVAAAAAGAAAGAAAAAASKKTWIEIQLVDKRQKPIPNQNYSVALPDGSPRTGRLDENGFALVDGIDPGQCKVTFPDFDAREWKKV